jgi:hypothetical protein
MVIRNEQQRSKNARSKTQIILADERSPPKKSIQDELSRWENEGGHVVDRRIRLKHSNATRLAPSISN